MNINTKKIRNERLTLFELMVLPLLEDWFDISIIAPKHYRIVSRINNKAVDYFPLSQKMFLLKEQKWGRVDLNSLETKLKKYLKTE